MMGALLALIVGVLVAGSAAARADEMDGWCAQVKKASSIVICSDPQLRREAISRNKLFEAARETLSADEYKALTEDQSRWIKSYTARCGVSLDGAVPALPVPQAVIDCYRRESIVRSGDLAYRLAAREAATNPPSGLPKCDSPAGSAIIGGGAGGCVLEQPAPQRATALPPANAAPPPVAYVLSAQEKATVDAWFRCLMEAADALASQPDLARTVTDAAFGSCDTEETAVRHLYSNSDQFSKMSAETMTPKVLARVMAIRAARAKLRKENPETKPAIDYNRM